MATDVNDTLPRSMSLSRRYLSLPQELTGASLPPKVSGRQHGIVTLCVAHILPSAVSSSPLPPESLVRVRWWGEETPGSLFRPSLLSGDGGTHTEAPYSPHRIIAMKYPVNVLPEQLLEYFHDMGHLTLDVIDRHTRRKFGECWLPLDLHRDNQVLTTEEKLVALRKDNALCEIKPSEGEKGEVAGYLAVTFHVQWTEQSIQVDENVEIVEQEEMATVVSMSDWSEIIGSEATKEKFEVESKMIDKEEPKYEESKKKREEKLENRDFQRIQKLLEKGKALQQSMERAVTDDKGSNEEVVVREKTPDLTHITVDKSMHTALLSESDLLGSSVQWDKASIDGGRLSSSLKAEHSAENESELVLSSIRSNSSEAQVKRVGASAPIFSGSTLDQHLQREAQQRIQHQTVLKDSMDEYKSFQFAVMLEGVSNIKLSVLGDKVIQTTPARLSSNPIVQDMLDAASITLRYTVPSHFSRISPGSNKFDRTVSRKLRSPRWFDSVPLLWADFSGNIHIFQSDFTVDSRKFFSTGYLIIETWLQTAKNTERRLLGLSKVPLRQLAVLFSYSKDDLLSAAEKPLPCVGVDDRFPIEDPFSGHLSGYLRARVCIGTAEQLLVWAKTIRSVIKLQGIIRGVVFRKQFRRFITFRAAPTLRTSQIHSLAREEHESDSQSTAPTLTTTRGGPDVIGFDNRVDTSEKQVEYVSDDLDYDNALQDRPALRKIRFDIRESWRSVMQLHGQKSKKQSRGWNASPLLGCELQGQLVITGNYGLPGNVKGVPFALWWDAVNSNLNSCFIHTFRARGAYLKEKRSDLALMGPQSQVLFALHVENGFFGTQSRETITGEARLNLYEAFGKRMATRQQTDGSMQNAEVEESWTDVDVPIVWENRNSEQRELPSAVPLKLTYFTSSISQAVIPMEPINMEAASLEGEQSYDLPVDTEHQFDENSASDAPQQQGIEVLPQAEDGISPHENSLSGSASTSPVPLLCDDQSGHSLVLASEEEEQARGSASSLSGIDDEWHGIDSLSETDEQLVQSTGLELTHVSEGDAADTVLGHSMELDDPSSSNGLVQIETASKLNSGAGEEELPGAISSCPKCAIEIESAEKAVQVDLTELGLQVEMVACAVQTAPTVDSTDKDDGIISEHSNDGTNVGDRAEQTKLTVDVGCDAMEIEDMSSENHSDTEEEAPQSVLSTNQELDDVISDVEAGHCVVTVPSDTSSMPDSEALLPDDISPSHSFVSEIGFVDKAVQADPVELGLEVEMVDCSVQTDLTADSKDESDARDSEESDDADEKKITVDVGCDEIEFADDDHDQSEEEEPLPTTSSEQEKDGNTVEVEIVVPSPQGIVDLVSNLHPVEQATGNNNTVQTTLQNEKLDLVYEMLREMRGYIHQPAAKAASVGDAKGDEVSRDHNPVTGQRKSVAYRAREISDKHSSCPSSPISRVSSEHPARTIFLDKNSTSASQLAPTKIIVSDFSAAQQKRCSCPNSPVTQDPNSLQSPGASMIKNIERTTRLKPTTALANNPKKSSPQTQLIDQSVAIKTRGLDAQRVQRTSYRNDDDRKSYRHGIHGSIHQLSMSNMCAFKRRSDRQSEGTTGSSVRSLFAHDSETERIARIMQGSMNYWMKDDCSSSGGEELEEATDDDCYF